MTRLAAASRLAEVLARENAALAAMDLTAAVALLPEKTAAFAALEVVRDQTPGHGLPSAQGAKSAPTDRSGNDEPALAPVARRLRELALENRRLLERAMTAQQRVIGIVAQAAAAAAVTEDSAYGASGYRTRTRTPLALSTRA